ncbi:MAG: hypothetical protein FWD74_06550 [Actinomycetia bacterium]|nr:hypothetical protein [Actinomycetes bacterium]
MSAAPTATPPAPPPSAPPESEAATTPAMTLSQLAAKSKAHAKKMATQSYFDINKCQLPEYPGLSATDVGEAYLPVLMVGAFRFGFQNCFQNIQDTHGAGVYPTVWYDAAHSYGCEGSKCRKVPIPPNVSLDKLPKVAKQVPSGGSQPTGRFLALQRDLTQGKPLSPANWIASTPAEMNNLAYDAKSLATIVLIDHTYVDVSASYNGGGAKIYRCDTHILGINVAQGRSFYQQTFEGYIDLRVNVPIGQSKVYLACHDGDSLFNNAVNKFIDTLRA